MRRRLTIIFLTAAVAGGLAGAAIATSLDAAPAHAPTVASAGAPQLPTLALPETPVRGALRRLTPEEIYRKDAPGVVLITDTQRVGRFQARVLGSGFVIDPRGDVVTNDHVVQGARAVRVGFPDGSSYPAKVVGTDPSTDLAVLRVSAPSSALHVLSFDRSSTVQVGEPVYAIGNPFGLEGTMTSGIVSAIGRSIQAPNGLTIDGAIQTDAAINHGNSGGPLVDRYGRVIGVTSQIESGGSNQGNVGVGFAVPSDVVDGIVAQLLAHGRAEHPWLGVSVEPIDPLIAASIKGLPSRGVLLIGVVPGSPAAAAHLKASRRLVRVDGVSALVGGDAIVSVDGRPIASPAELEAAVLAHRPRERLRLGLVRQGRHRTVTVRLGTVPSTLAQRQPN
jgi:putative serine protease PepD